MLQAYSKSELLSLLKAINISLPKRSKGRAKKEHAERYDIAHLLSTLAAEDQLSYPLCLIRRERPDFLLTLETMQIGIELTTAIHQNEAHKDKLREDMNCGGPYYLSPRKVEEGKKSGKELMKEIQEDQPGRGWDGDELEKEWSEIMAHSIKEKVDKLKEYAIFKQNWLFIYNNSNLHLTNKLSIDKADNFLRKKIDKGSFLKNKFCKIYILTGPQMLECSNERTQFYPLNDLWKQEEITMPPVSHPFKRGALVILMNYADHAPPHVHVKHQGDVRSYRIEIITREWMQPGRDLQPVLKRLVETWVEAHETELLEQWDNARNNRPVSIVG